MTVRRVWQSGDVVELQLKLVPRLVVGDHLNAGKAALCCGSLVLAADESLMAGTELPFSAVALASSDLTALNVVQEPAHASWQTWAGAERFSVSASKRSGGAAVRIGLVPFADAGATGSKYKVWLPLPGHPSANALIDGIESRSRAGNRNESINDDDRLSFAVTFNGTLAAEDWFGVTLDAPAAIRRIVFAHGKSFHDGGWFVGKPRVEILREGGAIQLC